MLKQRTTVVVAAVAFAASALGIGASPSGAATNPFQRGPDPTSASIEAATGPFATASLTVANADTPNFGAATIYYPTSTAEGTFGAVAISPGFTETQSAISWLGPRLASQGFVVITFNTNSTGDNPASRGTQLLAALDYVRNTSAVRDRVDGNRLAVMGHSMGGGGSLEASKTRPTLEAAVPLAAWDTDKTWPEIQTPTLLVGAQNDSVAPVNNHSIRFYESMPATLQKGYLELAGASHNTTNSPNTTAARFAISWLKRFVDNDTRYDQFLCPTPSTSSTISQYRSTCPYTS
jgi:alpha-beta hydrolase superfamily lysophospholipase